MKRQALSILAMLTLLLAVGTFANAQSGHKTVIADVPFAFQAGTTTISSGKCIVEPLRAFGVVGPLLIQSWDAHQGAAYILTNAIESRDASSQMKLVFHKYGDRYFLSQVWLGGSGNQLPMSRREMEMAQNGPAEELIILARLR